MVVEEAKTEAPSENNSKPEISIIDDKEDEKQNVAPAESPASKKNKKKKNKTGATPSAADATKSI